MQIVTYEDVESRILNIRNTKIIIDSDVAELYQVKTKQINEAVNRNLDKFPDGYVFQLTKTEKTELVANCDRFDSLKHSTVQPKAFTEKGLYMLATILKSPIATKTTLLIIDTFARVRELARVVHEFQDVPEDSSLKTQLMKKSGDIIADLIVSGDDLDVVGTETTYEMNFAIFKVKKTVKKAK